MRHLHGRVGVWHVVPQVDQVLYILAKLVIIVVVVFYADKGSVHVWDVVILGIQVCAYDALILSSKTIFPNSMGVVHVYLPHGHFVVAIIICGWVKDIKPCGKTSGVSLHNATA